MTEIGRSGSVNYSIQTDSDSEPSDLLSDEVSAPKVPVYRAQSANLLRPTEHEPLLRKASVNPSPQLDNAGETLTGRNKKGVIFHKAVSALGATAQLPARAPHLHWGMLPKSLPKELNTGAIGAGVALDSLALPGRIYGGVKAGKTWAENAAQKAHYQERASQWKALGQNISDLTEQISTKQQELDDGDVPVESIPRQRKEIRQLKEELKNAKREKLGMAEARYKYQSSAAKASRAGWQVVEHTVGGLQAATGVARGGLLLAGQTAAGGAGFIGGGVVGVVGGAIVAGVGVKDTHQNRKGLQRADSALRVAQWLDRSDDQETRRAGEDLKAIAEGMRAKRKRGIVEGLANVFMGSTSMAAGGAAIGLGVAMTGLAVASVATFGIAAAAIGGAALLGAIGLGAYKYFSARSERKQAQAAAEQVGNLSQQIRHLKTDIFHAEEEDRGPLQTQIQDLEVKLRAAELTLYRLSPDAAMHRLSDLMASDDDEISRTARQFAEQLVGNDQELLHDLGPGPQSLELIRSQAYGV
jgi:hypothetical protein